MAFRSSPHEGVIWDVVGFLHAEALNANTAFL